MSALKRILLFGFFSFCVSVPFNKTNAQFGPSDPFTTPPQPLDTDFDPPTDPCNTPQNPDEPPVYCPIDGGLAFLLFIGAGYGFFARRSADRQDDNESSYRTTI